MRFESSFRRSSDRNISIPTGARGKRAKTPRPRMPHLLMPEEKYEGAGKSRKYKNAKASQCAGIKGIQPAIARHAPHIKPIGKVENPHAFSLVHEALNPYTLGVLQSCNTQSSADSTAQKRMAAYISIVNTRATY